MSSVKLAVDELIAPLASAKTLRARAEELKEIRLKWLEEPLWPPENFDGLAELRRSRGIPIAAGENVYTLLDFKRLLDAKAVDFVQPSVAKMGGVSEMRTVFPLAAVHNIAVMPHSFYDGPGLLAAIHLTAACGTVDSMIEWRRFDVEAPRSPRRPAGLLCLRVRA